jgi:hypothetical protein
MVKGYTWLCDRCKVIVFNDPEDYVFWRQKIDDSSLIIERGKKGGEMHFCSETCCRKHRGDKAGLGRLFVRILGVNGETIGYTR